MTFVQVIELRTTRPSEVEALIDDWLVSTEGRRSLLARPGPARHDVQLVEFPSYEAAMAASALPETAAIAEQLSALCDEPLSLGCAISTSTANTEWSTRRAS